MDVTKKVADYIHDLGINLSELSRKTEIPYATLYACVGDSPKRPRDLRADELLEICEVLKVNPMIFTGTEENEKGGS